MYLSFINSSGECRICFKIPKDGVHLQQCQNGHLTCRECMKNMRNCGECREPLTHKIREAMYLIRLFLRSQTIWDFCHCIFTQPP